MNTSQLAMVELDGAAVHDCLGLGDSGYLTYEKLGVSDRAAAVAVGLRRGLIG